MLYQVKTRQMTSREGLEDDSSAAQEHETRQVNRKLEIQPSSSSSLARPRGEAVVSQTDVKLVRKASEVLKTRITCSFSG